MSALLNYKNILHEDIEERLAIIAEGCKVSQSEAERIYAEQTRVNPYAELEARAKMKKFNHKKLTVDNNVKYIDNKSLSAGERESGE
jgi:hypothetical protein